VRVLAEADLVRVFIGESDKHDEKPLYEIIVSEARKRHMAGATVLRGLMGFGSHSLVHTAKILRLSEDLPIIVEIVDAPDRISEFLPELDRLVGEGLITIEKARVLAYRHDGSDKPIGNEEG
jgi:PII-like signaling protein